MDANLNGTESRETRGFLGSVGGRCTTRLFINCKRREAILVVDIVNISKVALEYI